MFFEQRFGALIEDGSVTSAPPLARRWRGAWEFSPRGQAYLDGAEAQRGDGCEDGGMQALPIQGVRAAVPLDAAPIATIQVRSWQTAGVTAETLAAMSPAEVADAWSAAIAAPPSSRHRVLVAVSDGEVVGFAALAPATDPDADPVSEGEIVALHVDPSHRVAGHGSRLLAASVDGLRADDCAVAYHWMIGTDLVSRSFFVGAGWAPDGALRELDLHGDGITTVGQVRLHTALGDQPPD